MKKLIFTITLFASCFFKTQAQSVLTTQSFDTAVFPPTGWAIKQPVLATPVWARRTNGANGTVVVCATHSGAGLARFTSRAVINGYTQNLISKKVDYTNRGTGVASINFWMYRDTVLQANPDSLTVFINTTDSFNTSAVRLGAVARNKNLLLPDTQAVVGWYLYSFTVPTTFNTANNYFIFKGTSNTPTVNQGANIFIDDVSYLEYPPICTGTPNVGTVVAPSLLCNGGGNANLALTTSIANAGGITYNWQQAATASGPWTSFSTAGNTASIAATATTFIQCVANCSYSGLTYTTPVATINVSTDTLPIVTLLAKPQTICNGSSGAIIAAGSYNYTWAPVAQYVSASGDSIHIAPIANSQYTVTATNASGCSTVTGINIIVSNGPNTNITAFPNDSICKGDSIVLNSVQGNTNGLTYAWSNGVTTRRDTLVLNASASYTVVVTNAAGCTRADTINITVMPDVISGFNYTNAVGANALAFTNTSTNATAYTWYFGNGDSSTMASPTATYTVSGVYTITQVAKGFCGADSTVKVILVAPEGLGNKTISTVNVYPNPTSGDIIYCTITTTDKNATAYIYDMTGKLVLTQKVISSTPNQINISALTKGIYTLKINGVATKITKQ
jgi:Secretion system C-terminal sorting domain